MRHSYPTLRMGRKIIVCGIILRIALLPCTEFPNVLASATGTGRERWIKRPAFGKTSNQNVVISPQHHRVAYDKPKKTDTSRSETVDVSVFRLSAEMHASFLRDAEKGSLVLYLPKGISSYDMQNAVQLGKRALSSVPHEHMSNAKILAVATVDRSSLSAFNISFTPCFKLLLDDRRSDDSPPKRVMLTYRGPPAVRPLLHWIRNYENDAVAIVDDVEEFQRFVEDFDVFLFGAFKSRRGLGYVAFANAALFDEVPFVVTTSKSLLEKLHIERTLPSVSLIKRKERRKNEDAESDSSRSTFNVVDFQGQIESSYQIDAFVLHNQLPTVSRWSTETHAKIFSGPFSRHVLLFLDESDDDASRVFDAFVSVSIIVSAAISGSTRPVFVIVPSSEASVTSYFGIASEATPAVVFMERQLVSPHVIRRFQENILTAETLLRFLVEDDEVRLFRNSGIDVGVDDLSKMVRTMRTSSSTTTMRKLDSDSFNSVVFGQETDVLVLFHHPTQPHFQKLQRAFRQVARERRSAIFAEVDCSTEIINPLLIPIDDQRGLVLYPKGRKSEHVRYVGEANAVDIAKFLDSNTDAERSDVGVVDDPKVCKDREEIDGSRDVALVRWFRENRLQRWIRLFLDLGVECTDDLQYISRNDLIGMGMSVVHQRKYFAAYEKLGLQAVEVLE